MFNEVILRRAGINVEDAVARFAGKSEMFEKYLRRFPDDATFTAIKPALDANEYAAAREAVHALKGLCGNFSMTELYDACINLLSAIKQERFTEIDTFYARVETLYTGIIEAIRTM